VRTYVRAAVSGCTVRTTASHPRHAQVFARAGGGRSAFRLARRTSWPRRCSAEARSTRRRPSSGNRAISLPLLIFRSARPPPLRARRQSRSEKRLLPSLFLSFPSLYLARRTLYITVRPYIRTYSVVPPPSPFATRSNTLRVAAERVVSLRWPFERSRFDAVQFDDRKRLSSIPSRGDSRSSRVRIYDNPCSRSRGRLTDDASPRVRTLCFMAETRVVADFRGTMQNRFAQTVAEDGKRRLLARGRHLPTRGCTVGAPLYLILYSRFVCILKQLFYLSALALHFCRTATRRARKRVQDRTRKVFILRTYLRINGLREDFKIE